MLGCVVVRSRWSSTRLLRYRPTTAVPAKTACQHQIGPVATGYRPCTTVARMEPWVSTYAGRHRSPAGPHALALDDDGLGSTPARGAGAPGGVRRASLPSRPRRHATCGVVRRPGWEVMGQQAPGAATPQDVEDGIDEHPLLVAQRRPNPWWGQQGSEVGPLGLRQVRRIALLYPSFSNTTLGRIVYTCLLRRIIRLSLFISIMLLLLRLGEEHNYSRYVWAGGHAWLSPHC